MRQIAWAAFALLLMGLGLAAFGDAQAVEVGEAMISGLLVGMTILAMFWISGGM